MSAEKIIQDWKQRKFSTVYWMEGEEEFYIDKVVNYAEHHILSEAEAGFNLTVFYGRDTNWADVVNACMRYPMFADKQVVLLKEAQHMKEIEKLEHYIEHPLASTILVVAYKEKKVDGRSKLARLLKDKAVLVSTKKMYENQLPQWTNDLVEAKGFSISQKALMLLVDHIGNDLSRINNEVEKVLVNLHNRKNITEDDIEKYIGVSKEYNVFELQNAIAKKDMARSIKILQYFEHNPKAAPIQLVLPSIYNFFSKLYMLHGLNTRDEKVAAATLSVSPFFIKDYFAAAQKYNYEAVEKVLLLLHDYNLKSLGINAAGTEGASLMKEMVAKMMM